MKASKVTVSYDVPKKATASDGDTTRAIDIGAWVPKKPNAKILTLDATEPSSQWHVRMSLGVFQPDRAYYAFGEGNGNSNFGSIDFTAAEIAQMVEGEWMYQQNARPWKKVRTTDLVTLRRDECKALRDY